MYNDVLDIYYYFNLSSDKANYPRDQNFRVKMVDLQIIFYRMLALMVKLLGSTSGNNVISINNILAHVSFSGVDAGGVWGGVKYVCNRLTDVTSRGIILKTVTGFGNSKLAIELSAVAGSYFDTKYLFSPSESTVESIQYSLLERNIQDFYKSVEDRQ